MCRDIDEKRKTTNDSKNSTIKSRKNQNAPKKGNTGSGQNQISRDERKKLKTVPQENEKTTRNQAI